MTVPRWKARHNRSLHDQLSSQSRSSVRAVNTTCFFLVSLRLSLLFLTIMWHFFRVLWDLTVLCIRISCFIIYIFWIRPHLLYCLRRQRVLQSLLSSFPMLANVWILFLPRIALATFCSVDTRSLEAVHPTFCHQVQSGALVTSTNPTLRYGRKEGTASCFSPFLC